MFVAVYGSLKKGFGNHILLKHSKFIGEDIVKGFEMRSMGSFPFIRKGFGNVHVEIYKVDDATMLHLDRLEGYPYFYTRIQVRTEKLKKKVWIYVIKSLQMDFGKNLKLITLKNGGINDYFIFRYLYCMWYILFIKISL